jgi:hypothetical protein
MKKKLLIVDLTKYFLEQDREIIAKALAGAMLDIHRFLNTHKLKNEEFRNLVDRSLDLENELIEFAKNDALKPLVVSVRNGDDDYEL